LKFFFFIDDEIFNYLDLDNSFLSDRYLKTNDYTNERDVYRIAFEGNEKKKMNFFFFFLLYKIQKK